MRFNLFMERALLFVILNVTVYMALFGYWEFWALCLAACVLDILAFVALAMVRNGRPLLGSTIGLAIVIASCSIAAYSLGLETNMHLSLLLVAVVVFVLFADCYPQYSIYRVGVLIGTYILLEVVLQDHEPVYALDPEIVMWFRVGGIGICATLLSMLAYYYSSLIVTMEQKLQKDAHMDALTGCFNRRHLYDIFDKSRNERSFGVCLLDIDHFKTVNDSYGHEVGDAALIWAVQKIRSCMREEDYLVRLGGEEFLLMVDDCSRFKILAIAECIREHIDASPFEYEGVQHKLTVTIGVHLVEGADILDVAISEVDDALYQGKRAGRNCVRIVGGVDSFAMSS